MIDERTIDHIASGRALVLLDRFRLPRAWATVTSIPLATKRRTSAVPIAPDPRMATFLGSFQYLAGLSELREISAIMTRHSTRCGAVGQLNNQ